jgi:hypothetical protein
MDNSDQHNHYDTPTKAKVCGAVEFLEDKCIPHFKSEVFDHLNIKHRQGWAMISEAVSRHCMETSESGENRNGL